MKQHTHTLTPGLVETLKKFALGVKEKGNKIHTRRDIVLDISQYNNFQKLKYWGLVAKHGEPGYWVLTRRGLQFLRGEINVPKKVLTEGNRKTGESLQEVDITNYKTDPKYWQTNFESVDVNQGALDLT